MNTIPRRNQLENLTESEIAIQKAINEVELLGCNSKLTDAVVKLSEAKNLVADFIDSNL